MNKSAVVVTPSRVLWRVLLILVAAAGTGVVFFAVSDHPFLWTFICWALLAAAVAWRSNTSAVRAVSINFAAIILAFGAYEAYLVLGEMGADPTRYGGSYVEDYFEDDDLLGYGPRTGIVATAEKFHDERVIYSVNYTIGDHGLRIGPPVGPKPRGCVLFFGGSVTFGEGVEDEQAMPYQLGVITNGAYRVYNFAFHGYGPHQMLAALQGGRVDQAVACRPTHVIYQGILPHVERVAGLTTWDAHGPRYLRASGGGVERAGHFDDELKASPWRKLLQRWLTYDTLFGRRRAANAEEVMLFADVIAAARDFVVERYRGAHFHVILWDNRFHRSNDAVLAALSARDLQVHRISNILRDFEKESARYELDEHDRHPTAEAHGIIARYLADQVIAERQ